METEAVGKQTVQFLTTCITSFRRGHKAGPPGTGKPPAGPPGPRAYTQNRLPYRFFLPAVHGPAAHIQPGPWQSSPPLIVADGGGRDKRNIQPRGTGRATTLGRGLGRPNARPDLQSLPYPEPGAGSTKSPRPSWRASVPGRLQETTSSSKPRKPQPGPTEVRRKVTREKPPPARHCERSEAISTARPGENKSLPLLL